MENEKDKNIRDTTRDISLIDNPVRWSRYVLLKGQKLSQAVYLVTSLLPDSEPLKWRLRDISLDILSDVSALQPALSPLFKSSVLETASVKIAQIITWLEVSLAGFSGSDNFILLKQEYLNFNQILTEQIEQSGLPKLLALDNSDMSGASKFPEEVSNRLSDKMSIRKLSDKNQNELKKSPRREIIISFLKNKDWSSIKDIAGVIKGCSEKTIQRELTDLVGRGILLKKGARRWSRYKLA